MNRSPLPALPCTCASLRRAARLLTQRYEEALRPVGLRASQFTVLQMLSLVGEANQGEIARVLAMDSTTLTRTLGVMTRSGWLARRHGDDRREWRFRLAPGGQKKLKQALPRWERVQETLRRKLGQSRWDALRQSTDDVVIAISE
jgi:DNA-binding MarR family transcriptional regulator